jgi:hypothetical protein
MFIIATANKQFQLTAGKFVPVSNVTMMNVRMYVCMHIFMFDGMYAKEAGCAAGSDSTL